MSNKILIFALFAAAVNASPLVGQEKCLWGPSYWCENIKQAKECDAVQHCRTKVWTMEVKAACDVCEEVVGKVRDFLSTKKTETEMIEYFEQACTTIAGPLAPMCKKAVDQYGPIILQHMIKLMEDSQKVCESFGLCSTRAKNTVVAQLIAKSLPVQLQPRIFLAPGPVITKPIKPMGESPQCVICEFVMNELKSILDENSTKEEIEQAVDQICDYLPSTVSPECTQFVNKYGPMIISILVEEVVPSKVCNELGLCSSGNDLKAEKHVTFVEQSNGTCEFCTEVMTYVKAVLADNATQQELLSLLKEVCNALPSQLSSECNALISEYGQAILSIIVTSDPHDLCEEFGLCPSSLKGKNVDIGVTTNRMRSGAML